MSQKIDTATGVPINPVELTGSNVKDIVLQNAATATGDGSVYTVTTGKESITLVASGTATSFTVQFQVQASDGNWYLINGTNVGTGGASGQVGQVGTNAQASSTTVFGQVYEIDLARWKSFKAAVTAVSGGNVSVNGRLTYA